MSDTIIMYENGKAVGGEGHPTNADEITFNNEDTGLVSEEVESAIKEVNAKVEKGSVSVTADGVKTYSALLTELTALVDFSKVNAYSKLSRARTSASNIFNAAVIGADFAAFSYTYATTNGVEIICYAIGTGHVNAKSITINTAPNVIVSDFNNEIVPADMTITLYY